MFNQSSIAKIASSFLMLATLTSCAKAPQASCEFNSADKNVEVSKEIAIVIAPNSGFVDFENVLASTLPKIQGLFKDKKNATLSVVLADGNPEIESSSIIEVEKPFSSQTDIDDEVENAISEISRVYRCALGLDGVSSGASEESNLTLALSKAAGTFETPGTQREIFVLSNGISTAGQVNFSTDGVPTKDGYVEKVGDYENALVDLQGANVTWIGLGQTDGSLQEEFDTQVIEALTGFWSLFIEKSNGTPGSIKQGNVVGGDPNPNSLNISPVASGFEKICVSADLGIDQGLVFKGNSAEFVEPASTARASIENIANDINASSCFGKVIVTGYVSSDQDKSSFDGIGDIGLSQRRANVVKDLLRDFGVSVEIEAIGKGFGGKDEWNSDGTYDDALGEENRIVKIQEQK
jgi:hypothetical protein